MVGDGPQREYLQRLSAKLNLSDIVRWEGAHPKPLIYYEAADVFVMTPKEVGGDVEGYGIVYLEAGALGLPVIGSRTGGVVEAIDHGETGLLVNPGDPEGLAKAIIALLEDEKLREKLGKRGREKAKQHTRTRLPEE